MSETLARRIVFLFMVAGIIIGLLGVAYCWYISTRGLGDGKSGALAFLAIFGFPMSLFEMLLECIGVIKTTDAALLCSSICFVINWSFIGFVIGKIVVFIRNSWIS